MAASQNCYGETVSKRRRALSPIARNIRLRSPPFLPGPLFMEERDPRLLPHQLCVKDFRVFLLYSLSSQELLSSVINSGCLSSNEKEEILCKVGVRCWDCIAYVKDTQRRTWIKCRNLVFLQLVCYMKLFEVQLFLYCIA